MENMADEEVSWRSQSFRQNIRAYIEEDICQSGDPKEKTVSEMETHIFQKAKTREEYIGLVARLKIQVRKMRGSSQTAIEDTENSLTPVHYDNEETENLQDELETSCEPTFIHDNDESRMPFLHWNRNTALLLLKLYKDFEDDFSSTSMKKKHVWNKIAENMNFVYDYNVTALQCENKFKNMSAAYRKASNINKKSGSKKKTCLLYDELEELFCGNHVDQPIATTSSLDGYLSFSGNETKDTISAERGERTVYQRKKKQKTSEDILQTLEEAIEKRHTEKMEKMDKIIDILNKISEKM